MPTWIHANDPNQPQLDEFGRRRDNDNIQYNFLEKKDSSLYKSMQKTLKSDHAGDGSNVDLDGSGN